MMVVLVLSFSDFTLCWHCRKYAPLIRCCCYRSWRKLLGLYHTIDEFDQKKKYNERQIIISWNVRMESETYFFFIILLHFYLCESRPIQSNQLLYTQIVIIILIRNYTVYPAKKNLVFYGFYGKIIMIFMV